VSRPVQVSDQVSRTEHIACRVDLARRPAPRAGLPQNPAMVGTNSGKDIATDSPHKIRRAFMSLKEEGDSPAREHRAAHCLRFAVLEI
jgi:hypothetical protein